VTVSGDCSFRPSVCPSYYAVNSSRTNSIVDRRSPNEQLSVGGKVDAGRIKEEGKEASESVPVERGKCYRKN